MWSYVLSLDDDAQGSSYKHVWKGIEPVTLWTGGAGQHPPGQVS